ncbi:MAG: type II secretion system protein [Patescibacteria group bacterium]
MFEQIKKIKKISKIKRNGGMTYVELIVVLSIFAVMSSIVLFNYGKFQEKVDIKNLANDVALQIVQAQKSALSGKVDPSSIILVDWIPSYGVYFDTSSADNKKSFIDFVDLDGSKDYFDTLFCPAPRSSDNPECMDKIAISSGNFISSLDIFYQDDIEKANSISNLSIAFVRPDSSAIIKSEKIDLGRIVSYAQITITSTGGINSYIKIYPSGRVQIN